MQIPSDHWQPCKDADIGQLLETEEKKKIWRHFIPCDIIQLDKSTCNHLRLLGVGPPPPPTICIAFLPANCSLSVMQKDLVPDIIEFELSIYH